MQGIRKQGANRFFRMAEITNNTLITIVLLALAITLLSTWALFTRLGGIQVTGLTSAPTGTVSASVAATTDIFLKNNTVDFGTVSVGNTFDTSVNYSNASQFLLRNDGSVRVNVTITATTALWASTSGNNSNYRLNFSNATGNTSMTQNCGDTNVSQNTWYTMPLTSSQKFLCGFNFTDNNDFARIDIQITVPTGEASGAKTSSVTFTASQA